MPGWPRYQKMRIGALGIVFLHKRNPWVAMFCSIALPGLGHFYCGAYIRGAILMSWEILINQSARINLAIMLSALGHHQQAQQVIVFEWALMYPLFYVLSIWDSVRLAIDINKLVELEERQPIRQFQTMSLSQFELNYLGKRNPWVAAFLSAFLAGSGHLYNAQFIKAFVLMGWHIAIWLNAGLNEAILVTVQGRWSAVHQLIDYQWLAFLPSIHLFNIWNAYSDAVELNKLYEEGVEHFLRSATGQEGRVTVTARPVSDA